MPPPRDSHSALRVIALIFAGIILVGSSFMFASSDFAYGARSLLATTLSAFSSNPTITITRNANSPSGVVAPGRLQVLAVLDVKPRFIKQIAYIQNLPVGIEIEKNVGNKLYVSDIVLDYRYCLSKGDVYGYGYSYDDSCLFCRNITASPSSGEFVDSNGEGQIIKYNFTNALPVYPNQVSGELTISAKSQYRAPDQTGREIADIMTGILSGAVASTNVCTRPAGGNGLECRIISPEVNVNLAYGNELVVAPHYGYGYAYLDYISPSLAYIGSTVEVRGWNLSKVLPSESLGIIYSGGGGFVAGIQGNSNSNDNVIQFTLNDSYCNESQCFSVTPGQYHIFAQMRKGISNVLSLNVAETGRPIPQPQSLTCDETAQAVVKSVGSCTAIDPVKYQNVYAACCQITRDVLLSLLNNALGDGIVDEHEKSVLLTALNSYLF